MKKTVKQTPKQRSSVDKKNTRPFTTGQTGYKENVYNNEEQATYQKSSAAKDKTKNTAGPKD